SRLPLAALLLAFFAVVAVQAAAPAALVKDINTTGALIPNNSSIPQHLTVSADTLYFSADDGSSGRELWKSDGTANGTKRVKNIARGSAPPAPGELTDLKRTRSFTATTVLSGTELWRSDGSNSGTVAVADINPAPGASSSPAELTVVTTVPTP